MSPEIKKKKIIEKKRISDKNISSTKKRAVLRRNINKILATERVLTAIDSDEPIVLTVTIDPKGNIIFEKINNIKVPSPKHYPPTPAKKVSPKRRKSKNPGYTTRTRSRLSKESSSPTSSPKTSPSKRTISKDKSVKKIPPKDKNQ